MKKALIFILMLTTFSIAAEEKVTIQIDGMTCGGCVRKVTGTLEAIEGVKSADVSLKPGSAAVVYESDQADPETMMSAIAGLGYKASMATLTVGEATHGISAKGEAQAEAVTTEAKKVSSKDGCPMAATCKKAGSHEKCGHSTTAAKAGTATLSSKKAEHLDVGHACPTITQCKELIDFHEAMHPLHMALSDGNFDLIRSDYTTLADKADAVKMMKCDESCVTDVRQFEKLRKNLLKHVNNLGKACKSDNNEKLATAFDKMHGAYVELGKLAK